MPADDESYRAKLQALIATTEALYRSCTICELNCHVDRIAGELGRCLLGREAGVYKEYLHFGEEESLIPTHTIFVSGCNLRCRECSDWKWIVTPTAAPPMNRAALVQRIQLEQAQGARNLHFVGGEADVNVLAILELLRDVGRRLPVVWNSNFYGTPQLMAVLNEFVSCFVVDLKHGPGECAERVTGVPHYFDVVTRNLALIPSQTEVIVRHLVLPGHLDCCSKPALRWLRAQHPSRTVNLMTGFYPFRKRGGAVPSRRLTNAEIESIIQFFQELKFEQAMLNGQWQRSIP